MYKLLRFLLTNAYKAVQLSEVNFALLPLKSHISYKFVDTTFLESLIVITKL